MTAIAMLQALLLGLLLATTPPWSDDLEESLWDLHIVTSGCRASAGLHPRIACRRTGFPV